MFDTPAIHHLQTVVGMILLRIISWTFQSKPFIRVGKRRDPLNRTASQNFFDALDLCCNFRGIGWNWSNDRVYITSQPEEVTSKNNATSQRKEFLRENILSYFVCSAIFEAGLLVVFRYPLEATPTGNSIVFFLKRIGYAFLYPTFAYTNLGGTYNLYAISSVFIFDQDIEEWPPFFNKPWKSTSLTEFWGKRWHQAFRYTFSQTGGKAFGSIFGRVGMVLGTFFVSGLFHDGGYWGMHRGRGVCCYTTPYFVLSGVGILLEAAVKAITGRRVGGTVGWTWTLAWLISCAMLTMPPYCMQDLLRSYAAASATQPFYITYLISTKLF